jgi:hypothetical protein
MIVDCDEGMIVALLRNWRSNRLQPQGVRLASLRPQLIERQKGVCPLCPTEEPPRLLNDNGDDTHIDHDVTVQEFAGKVLRGELTFDDAYRQLWAVACCRFG